jgi:hypothetical protein
MMSADPVLILTVSYTLAMVFAASAWTKIADIGNFEAAVVNYRLLPAAVVKVFARALPMVEAAAAIGLLIARTRLTSTLVLLGLLAVFTAAIAANLIRGRRDIDCGCFGPALKQRLSAWLIVRNATLIAAASMALLPAAKRNPTALDWSTVCFAVTAFVLIYAAANFLIAAWPRTLEYRLSDA